MAKQAAGDFGVSDGSHLDGRVRSGASWFYWVAALSFVNSVLIWVGAPFIFIFGLGFSMFVDGFIWAYIETDPEMSTLGMLFALGVSGVTAIVLALIGSFASERNTTVYIVGMVLYAFDALFCMLVGDFMAILFHAFALFQLWGGLSAALELARTAPSVMSSDAAP